MATIKQHIALNKIVENRGNIGKAMREAGYDKTTAKNPKNLTESEGFLSLCDEKGLTDDLLINALIEDIQTKKGNRTAELALGFKIKGKFIERNIQDESKRLTGIKVVFDRSFDSSLREEEKERLLNLLN